MKKLLLTGVSTAVLLSSAFVAAPKAEAATEANINYLSSSVVKKAKAGKLTKDGIQIGKLASYYNKSNRYEKDGTREFGKGNVYWGSADVAFVDFQSKISSSKRKVTRIVDKNIDDKRTIEQGEIEGKYGKPLMTDTVVGDYGEAKRVDMYKYITFFYEWDTDDDKAPILTGAVIMHNKTKSAQQKWFDYATGEADYTANNMNEYITSSEWAGL
ncbi:hypothetical protein [Macrococcus epidermidis]|uniref:hypothetical protein n=1 Tax=Macrococcus epidermidis TaxID=1902580 RepID=UPI0020B8EBFF|nr:hypothetical protein [Macrococcus epidermidis]UTH16711.1 hypothetical protein KFV12_02770 [Macrococcus epidermidis]